MPAVMRLILMTWRAIKNSRGILSLAFGTLKTPRHENLASVWENFDPPLIDIQFDERSAFSEIENWKEGVV
jgi:hypothetical protein